MPQSATPSVPMTPQRPPTDTGSQRAVRGQPQPSRFGPACHDVATIYVEGRPIAVSVRIAHDGIEYVGRLWFADPGSADHELASGIPDRAPVPGQAREDVLARALVLDAEDLARRHARALAERRRYRALRATTDEVLARIRYLNRVALLVRDGLLDAPGGAQELDITESQLHELVVKLRTHAGQEEI